MSQSFPPDKQAEPETKLSNTPIQKETSGRFRKWRLLSIVAAAVVCVFILFVLLLPTLLSTNFGTRTVLSFVNHSITGTVEVQNLSMGWFSGLQLDELTIHTDDQQEALSISSIQMPKTGVFSLISIGMGWQTQVELLTRQGKINTRLLQKALLPTNEVPEEELEDEVLHLPYHVALLVDLKDYQITLESDHASPVHIQLASVSVDAVSPASIDAQLDASMSQGERTGEFKLKASIKNLFNERGASQYEKADLDVELSAKSLPVTLLDELFVTPNGFMRELLGPELSAELQLKGTMQDMVVRMQATAQTLEAYGSVAVQGDNITIDQSPYVKLTLLPRAITALNPEYQLQAPVEMRLALDRFDRGAADDRNVGDIGFTFAFSLGAATLTMPDVGVVQTQGVQGNIESASLREDIQMMLRSDLIVNDAQGTLASGIVLSQLINAQGQLDPANMHIAINGDLRDAAIAELLDSMLDLGDLVQTALEGAMTMTWQGDLKLDNYQPAVGTIDLSANARNIQSELHARLTRNQFIMEPGQLLSLTVSPRLADRLVNMGGFVVDDDETATSLGLLDTATLALVIDELAIPREGLNADIARTTVQMKLEASSLSPTGIEQLEGVGLRDFVAELVSQRLSEDATLRVASRMTHNNQPAGHFAGSGRVDITAGNNEATAFRLRNFGLTISDLSVGLLEQSLSLPLDVSPALGNTLEKVAVNLQATSATGAIANQAGTAYNYTIAAQDPDMGLNIDLQGLVQHSEYRTELRMNPASVISVNLSTNSLNTYLRRLQEDEQQPPPWRATSSARLDVKFAKLDVIMLQDSPIPHIGVDIEATTSPFGAVNEKNQTLSVENFKATLKGNQVHEQVDLVITATIQERLSNHAPPRSASLNSQTSIIRGFADRSAPTGQHRMIRTNTTLPSFPVAMLEPFMTQGKELTAVLGETATFELVGELPGNINASISSPNLQTALKGNLNRDRVATLAEDFTGTLNITPEMATVFLGQLHPVLADAMGSERPVQWVVRPYDPQTQRPLRIDLNEPIDLAKLDISGMLDLGAIRMQRRGWLKQSIMTGGQEIIRILSLGVRLPDTGEGETYLANFTPMEFTLRDGVFQTEQLWLYAEDMVVGFQGNVNLNKQSYDMVMGVVGVTFLAGGPALFSQIIDPTNIFDIPVSGRQGSDPRIDWGIMSIYLAGSAGRVQLDNTLGHVPGIGRIGVGIIDAIGSGVQDEIRRSRQIAWTTPPPVEQAINRIRAMVRGKQDPAQEQQQEQAPATQKDTVEQPAQQQQSQSPRSRLLDSLRNTRERNTNN